MEKSGLWAYRKQLLEGLAGTVVEIGAGNGMNFAHYPAGVTSVRAVEPDPYLRTIALKSAAEAPVPVAVVDGLSGSLPAADGEFDAAVVSLVLCSVDQAGALREIRRVLKPAGQLRFLEHVRAPTAGMRRVQRVLDATIWPGLAGGCHMGRDTVGAMEAAGFRIDRVEEFVFPLTRIPTPASSCVIGVARPT